jgi:hypothetical protein
VAFGVVFDDLVRGLEDLAGRAVVRFEANDLGAVEVLVEGEDLRDVGAAPTVDRLIVVADDAQVSMFAGDGLDDVVLRTVRVLVLVDHHEAKAACELGANGFVFTKELH